MRSKHTRRDWLGRSSGFELRLRSSKCSKMSQKVFGKQLFRSENCFGCANVLNWRSSRCAGTVRAGTIVRNGSPGVQADRP